MTAPPKGRIRILKHIRKQVAAQAKDVTGKSDESDNDGPEKIEPLPEGYVQLYSYYAPGLTAGTHKITVNQHVEHPVDKTQTLDITSKQFFNVNGPRFNLPPNVVHQTYPPQGLADHNNVLPHIVFEDPHLPWEQEGSPRQDQSVNGVRARNMVPWMALWTFTEDELKLTDAELAPKSKGGLFPEIQEVPCKSTPAVDGRVQDKATFVMKLTMGEYLEMGGDHGAGTATVTIPVLDNDPAEPLDRDEQLDVIFVQRDQFTSLISAYDTNGMKSIPSDGVPDVSRYANLAHVRNINTSHMADTGIDDEGLYSVVLAHRTGPLTLKEAKPVIVHLVTIQDIENNIRVPLDPSKSSTDHVALVSLYNWTYMCLPPDQVNFVDSMRAIGRTVTDTGQCWLRAPDPIVLSMAGLLPTPPATPPLPTPLLPPTTPPTSALPLSIAPSVPLSLGQQLDALSSASEVPVNVRLAKRLEDGYALQRYLLQTGEETVAFYRGPLTPNYVPTIDEAWWPLQSNFSTDYQVLDTALGIMDITYSAAWQLGRTLGMADQAFTASLVRLRGNLVTTAMRKVKKQQTNERMFKTKKETVASLARSLKTLSNLNTGGPGVPNVSKTSRYTRPMVPALKFMSAEPEPAVGVAGTLSHANATTVSRSMFVQHVATESARVARAVRRNETSTSKTDDTDEEEVYIPFNEISVPASPDWQIVQTFILDKLSLHNIPAHYLLPDASHLPRESIRFFYIDTNWFDAFIDGALSIGNHLDREDDVIRQSLKRNLNRYFSTPYGTGTLNYCPQVPCFGFFLRSAVVTAFPNLEVHAPWFGTEDLGGQRLEVLRNELLENDTLLCLFDRMPDAPHWDPDIGITLAQPPHQQCFKLGVALTEDDKSVKPPVDGKLEVEYRSLYTITTDETPAKWQALNTVTWPENGSPTALAPVDNLPASVFDRITRTISFPAFGNAALAVLNKDMNENLATPSTPMNFFDDTPTSALVGCVLNNFISTMKIGIPLSSISPATAPPDTLTNPRKIRLPPDGPDDQTTWIPVPVVTSDPGLSPPAPPPPNEIPRPPVPPPGSLSPPAPAPAPMKDPTVGNNEAFRWPDDQTTTGVQPLNLEIGSQFVSTVFPLGAPIRAADTAQILMHPPSSDAYIPIDLVVRLVPPPTNGPTRQDTTHKLQLFSITIDVPVGKDAASLTSQYQGPGGKMLSNMRWNVHFNDNSSKGFIRFTLIPRSTTKLVPLAQNPDMSFVIYQVLPNGVKGTAQLTVQENYRAKGRTTPITKHYARAMPAVEKVKATA